MKELTEAHTFSGERGGTTTETFTGKDEETSSNEVKT